MESHLANITPSKHPTRPTIETDHENHASGCSALVDPGSTPNPDDMRNDGTLKDAHGNFNDEIGRCATELSRKQRKARRLTDENRGGTWSTGVLNHYSINGSEENQKG
jgi:hypothetical protein